MREPTARVVRMCKAERNAMRRTGKAVTLCAALALAGCHIHSRNNQTTAKDLGMAVYPQAQPVFENGKAKSADIDLQLGTVKFRLRSVDYTSNDDEEKIASFYKQALGRYGTVLVCRDRKPVGTATVTEQGLSCNDRNEYLDASTLEIKAGSKQHQHSVLIEPAQQGVVRFSVEALDPYRPLDWLAGKKS